MTKFSNKFKKTCFGPIFPIFGAKNIFLENPALSCTTSYGFLAPCQNSEKVNDTIQRKCPDRQKDRRTDRHTILQDPSSYCWESNKNNDTDVSEDCLLDGENDPTKIFEFVTIDSFVVVISCNTSEPIYFIKIVEKNVAKENQRDQFECEIFPGECNLKVFYLQNVRSKNIYIKKFFILNYDVHLTPDETFEPLVKISNDLTMNRDAYLKLLERM